MWGIWAHSVSASQRLRAKSKRVGEAKAMGDGSDLQLLSSFDTHTAQTPRRAVKICFLPLLLLLAHTAVPEETQRAMLEGNPGRA